MRAATTLLCSLLACSSIEVKPVGPQNKDATGLRFYRPWPYLWVTSGANGACAVQVVYLPRTDQEYVVRATAGLGSVSFKPVLADGWNLTSLDGQVDSKAAEVLTGLGGIAGALAAKKVGVREAAGVAVGLYVFDYKDGLVSGLRHIWPTGEEIARCKELAAAPEAGPASRR